MAHTSRPVSPTEPTADEVAQAVAERTEFLIQAPWETRRAQCALQAAIDEWDPAAADEAAARLLDYLARWATLAGPMYEAHSLADLLPLDTYGLPLARSLDLALLNQTRQDTARDHAAIVSSLLQTVRGDWRHDLPTASAEATPPPGDLHPDALVDVVRAALSDLAARLASPPQDSEALDPDLPRRIEASIEAIGGRMLRSEDIPDRDVVYEFLAHRFAYRPKSTSAADLLEATGFKRKPLRYRTESGLDFFLVEPTMDGMPAVVVFRGTEPDDLKDLKTDLEFQIGRDHFDSAERLGLKGLLQACVATTGRPADLCGHSLGGALAQLCAASWPELVGDIVTFQSPGLTRRNALRGDLGLARTQRPGTYPRVTHYIALNDIVHKAGQRHLTGPTIVAAGAHLDRGAGVRDGLGHSDMLLGTHSERARLSRLGLSAHWSPHTFARLGELPQHPTTEGSFHEAVRASVALMLELVQAHLLHPDEPQLLARMLPQLAAEALGEDSVTNPMIVRRLARRLARDLPRLGAEAVRSGAALLRRAPPAPAP